MVPPVRAFRFGVTMAPAASLEALVAAARRAEELGYDILLAPDHVGAQLSPIAAMAFAAASTERLRVGSYVFANDFRHPLVLAREAHSMHILTAGRFELGMGAGWDVSDYEKLGRTYDPVGRRIDRLTEAVPLVKRLLGGETVDHEGANYRMKGAYAGPPPVGASRSRILIGGSGPRVLRLAAREADNVGLHPRFNASRRARLGEATDEGTARKIAILRAEAGPRFEEIELNVMIARAMLVGRDGPLGSLFAPGRGLLRSRWPGRRTSCSARSTSCASGSCVGATASASATTRSGRRRWRRWHRSSPRSADGRQAPTSKASSRRRGSARGRRGTPAGSPCRRTRTRCLRE
jgi:probable F420-dependent oxidoreductase